MTDAMPASACRLLSRAECALWLQTHNQYLILCHAHPDGDTLGAGMGLRNLLRVMGKTAHLVCASPIPERLAFLTEERTQCTPEQLPAGFEWETVVTVDVASVPLLGDYAERFGGAVHLAIDHHGTNTLFAEAACVDGTLSACTELICNLGEEIFGWNDTDRLMPPEIAVPLYAGLLTDSGSFQYGAVTPRTHRRAAAMLASVQNAGLSHARIAERLWGSRPLPQVMAAKAAYEDLRFFCGGRVSLVTFTPKTMETYHLTDEDIDDVINLIRGIAGVRAAVHLKPRGEGVYKLSLRCAEGFNVARVAARFGGGGHACAAGCTIEGDAASAEAAIISALEEALAEESSGEACN
ncbi:MAG: hypothetical protein J6S76_03020 [Clostridia bacterium]|nr:hypothetical protein [Clostridia bacterium]